MKQALHEIWQAETGDNAYQAFGDFITMYEDKYPKETRTVRLDRAQRTGRSPQASPCRPHSLTPDSKFIIVPACGSKTISGPGICLIRYPA